jgi:glycosyltransferase involved in cell wall biosynthesis
VSTNISIVTINYNNKVGLQRTAASILSQGSDLFPFFEWLVIDGASTDNSLDFVSRLPFELNLTVVSESDSGIYNAMNKGISLAANTFCLFLNSGDTLYPSSLRELVSLLSVYNDSDVILFGHQKIYPLFPFTRICQPRRHASIPYGMPTSHQSIVYKTSILKKSPFDERYKLASDYAHLCLLFKLNLKFASCPRTLSSFYLDGVSCTFAGFWRGLQENLKIRLEILEWNLPSAILYHLWIAIKTLPVLLSSFFFKPQ